ncbi:DUF3545 family protein [Agaribacter marinus]|uniref:DUF3545 domain-containing protein n=1 Tax=Agaribacter marinus TaxID=1431249 RepID=A0AA37WII7_9ALTE|nr:DUF3545 family protein [Agaribacter marinus]GLR71118.1 hypothetical protein GCM10007852_20260 [Agaribacter marinus]
MESVDILSIIDNETRPTKTKSKKRKWREIEAIKEKYRLQRELTDMDVSLEIELEQLVR